LAALVTGRQQSSCIHKFSECRITQTFLEVVLVFYIEVLLFGELEVKIKMIKMKGRKYSLVVWHGS
jgi:hypothetical protein